MELADSTRLGIIGYLMLTMGITLPKATEILEELETSGLVIVKSGGQLEIKLLEDNYETH
ncbi:hypothetical protein HO924_04095 [Streptococcus suis]|uniref:hypothetical protein n=1 Tax=Streptococcus suis TaxID=1307 RepID=UPI0015568D2C|nr:hypothetical protein [Streptococcus suis]NQP33758.1 hypothetical protein [Streptococcus suis]NQP36115.1 hypothetical protein [Streptococcus suis]